MAVWFIALFVFGLLSLLGHPEIFRAVSPHYAVGFIIDNGFAGFLVLSEVILCATGGEALYADMGHLGSKPIRQAWYIVFFALLMSYFGQGAFVLEHQKTDSILFEMVKSHSTFLYIPFLILTLMATIIASQAMISAVMSVIYQGITTRLFPLMKIKFTSSHIKSQIYIGAVNWILLIAVLLMIVLFRESKNLAAAYGFAVTATMTISAIFMIFIFKMQNHKLKTAAAIFVFLVDLAFLTAVMDKIPHGGFWSLVIAALPFIIIKLWTTGNKRMYRSFRALPLDVFLESFNQLYSKGTNIKGTALFFSKSLGEIPPYMVHCIIRGNIIYEKNILITINTADTPYGVSISQVEEVAPGLSALQIEPGYLEILDLPKIFNEYNLKKKLFFMAWKIS
jgi:KUP system potassium uptake protein